MSAALRAAAPRVPVSQGGPVTMSSREIAELVEARHDSVMRTIERLAERGVMTLPPLVEVSNPGLGPKTVKEYLVNKRDSYVIVAQLSPEFTARLVDRWQELEAQAAMPAIDLDDPAFLRRALLGYTGRVIALEAKVAEQAPKVEFHDAVTEAVNCQTVQEVAKILGTGPNRLFSLLRERGLFTRHNLPCQEHLEAGRFRVVERKFNQHGETHVYSRTLVTGKGLTYIQRHVLGPGWTNGGAA